MLKHTEKKQAYLSEEQFVSNLKNRRIYFIVGEDTNDGEKQTMDRAKRFFFRLYFHLIFVPFKYPIFALSTKTGIKYNHAE